MINNNISNWINDIYEKYQENQDGKKHVERVNIDETSFKSNLLQCIKKSTIEDKSILCMQIYNQLAEDALDIGSDGSISIAPKVVAEAEKIEIVRREEIERINAREKLKNEIESAGIVVAASILTMTKDEYEQLSNEQKRDLFADATKDWYGTKEDAGHVYDMLKGYKLPNIDEKKQEEISSKIENNDGLTDDDRKMILGVDGPDVTDMGYLQIENAENAVLADITKSKFASIFGTKTPDGKIAWRTDLITRLSAINLLEMTEEAISGEIESMIEEHFISENEKQLLSELIENISLLEVYTKIFTSIMTARENRRALLQEVSQEQINDAANAVVSIVDSVSGTGYMQELINLQEVVRKGISGEIIDNDDISVVNESFSKYGQTSSQIYDQIKENFEFAKKQEFYKYEMLATEDVARGVGDNDSARVDSALQGVSGIDDLDMNQNGFDIIDDFGNENNNVLDFFKNISMERSVTIQSSDYTEYTYMQDNLATDYEYAEAPITTEEMEEALGNELLDFNFEELMVGEPAPVNEFSEEEIEMGDGDSKLNQGMVVEEVEVTPVSAQFVEAAEDLVDPVQEDINEKDDSTDEKQSLWTRLKNVYENIKTSIVKLLKLDKNKTKQLSEGTGKVVNVNFDNNKNNNELVQQFNLDFSRVGEITEKNEESRANGTPIKDDDGPSMG